MRPFVGLFLLLSASVPIYNHGAQHGQYKAHVEQPQSVHAVLAFAVHRPETQTEGNDPYDPRRDCLYRAYLAATIFGVFVALGGIYAIYTQTGATKKAAEATAQAAEATARSAKASEDSVKLQEGALKPWVNVGNWEAWIEKRTSKLRIRFQIINPTGRPVDLNTIRLETEVMSHGTQKEDIPVKGLLAPGNPHIVDATLELSDEDIEVLTDSKPLIVSIECSSIFADIRKKRWEQIFKRFLVFDKAILDTGDPPNKRITPYVRDTENQLRQCDEQ
jgi:hypothetical protein